MQAMTRSRPAKRRQRPRSLSLFPETERSLYKESTSGSFVDNLDLPIHRWFRYSAGFSGAWAGDLISREASARHVQVFDPFAGSGTTLIAAEQCGVESWGIDSHPFIARVARAKLAYRSPPDEYLARANLVLANAKHIAPTVECYAPLIRKCYTDEALEQLDSLRHAMEMAHDDSESARLVWLTLVSILRPTSHVGTANCQYLLPDRRKARVIEPFVAFDETARAMYEDMRSAEGLSGPRTTFCLDDARSCSTVPTDHFNLVVTSPPYPNNYDYADATRLELTFFGEIKRWGDLQTSVRQHLLRSCSQHVPDRAVNLADVLARSELDPIRDELRPVCEELGEVRLTRGGKKTYHNMIVCYFLDLALVWQALRRVCRSPSRVCFVVGDSAPYGVYVPVIEWLGKLATSAGFRSFTFEKTRDRNIKWKNRKHRVPLCEGRLWVEG